MFLWRWEHFVFSGSFYVMQNYDDGFLKLLNVNHTPIWCLFIVYSDGSCSGDVLTVTKQAEETQISNELLGKAEYLAAEELKILLYYTRFNLLIVCVVCSFQENISAWICIVMWGITSQHFWTCSLLYFPQKLGCILNWLCFHQFNFMHTNESKVNKATFSIPCVQGNKNWVNRKGKVSCI